MHSWHLQERKAEYSKLHGGRASSGERYNTSNYLDSTVPNIPGCQSHTQHCASRQQECHAAEKNGVGSSSRRTQHSNIRFFCIKDCITAAELELQNFPTDEIRKNVFFTLKSLWGSKKPDSKDNVVCLWRSVLGFGLRSREWNLLLINKIVVSRTTPPLN